MVGHPRRGFMWRRRAVSLVVAAMAVLTAVAVATLGVATPSAAQAPSEVPAVPAVPAGPGVPADVSEVTCSDVQTIELSDGSAAATIKANRNCWDGTSWYEVLVRDIACDSRAAHVELEFYNPETFINEHEILFQRLNRYAYRTEVVSLEGGCNTDFSTIFTSTNPNPSLFACAYGKNAAPWSNWVSDCATF